MSTIHQLYCTPGTDSGSLAGENASRALGNGNGTASLVGEEFQKYYRQIEEYVYYGLPCDASEENGRELCASTAPRRLFFLSLPGGLQVIGQVCYRRGGSGERGSSFAHLLLREAGEGQTRWSAVEALKLWGSPGWLKEDVSLAALKLNPLGSLAEMLGEQPAAISRHVFLSFLSTPADGAFHDPAEVIPARWRAMDPAHRREWFLDLFSLFLKSTPDSKGPVSLVVEPSVAALLFYGILRLLPPGPLRDTATISTYEPDLSRTPAKLAATWFCDPQTTQGRPELLAAGVVNTLHEVAPGQERPRSDYAIAILRRLLEAGWDEVDWQLATLHSVKAHRAEHLEALAAVNRLVTQLLETGSFANQNWRKSPVAANYLRKVLRRRVAKAEDPAALLKPIVGSSAHLTVLDLIAEKSKESGPRTGVDYLLAHLPADKVGGLLKLHGVPSGDKVRLLAAHVREHGTLPPKCDILWEIWSRGSKTRNPAKMGLLPHLLGKLPPEDLAKFFKRLSPARAEQALVGLIQLRTLKALKSEAITPCVNVMDEEPLVAMLREIGQQFLEDYPGDEPGMPRRLAALARSLAEHPREFRERLDLVLAGQHLIDERDQRRSDRMGEPPQARFDRRAAAGRGRSAGPGEPAGRRGARHGAGRRRGHVVLELRG